jgi:prepilin-type N-terminal cleavage/methylation domain-containing protein
MRWAKNKYSPAFTIVELLVVIVVIGILAAITVVSYNGITKKANESTLISDLDNNSRKLELYKVENGSYPTTLDNLKCPVLPSPSSVYCLKTSGSNGLNYASSNGSNYSMVATSSNGQMARVTNGTTPNTISSLSVGDAYGGGIVAYILQSGDPGYSATTQHGLIAANVDQSSGIQWAKLAYQNAFVAFGTLETIGSGLSNTDKIVAQNSAGTDYAAGLARSYNGGGYTDWYLPSRSELGRLYVNRSAIGASGTYWSSSQVDIGASFIHDFQYDFVISSLKYNLNKVRAVRSF